MIPPAASFFLLRECNLRCKFCFATYRDVRGRLPLVDALRVIDALKEAGLSKLTLVGGEPTLYPDIGTVLRHARDIGLTTSIVTNGARLDALLDTQAGTIDWVGLSVDSADERIQAALGRGTGTHVANSIRLAERCHRAGLKVKLNSVITRLQADEDMSSLVRTIRPLRWKTFQVLPVQGQNDGKVEDLLISDEAYETWVRRHAHLNPVSESNDLMRNSYVLVDPLGRFQQNAPGGHTYSAPILEVGVQAAWDSLTFDAVAFDERGGVYNW